MAFYTPKQIAKASVSKSLTNISIPLEQDQNISNRNRSVDELEFHKETLWDLNCRFGVASSSSSSTEIRLTRPDLDPTSPRYVIGKTSDTETAQSSDGDETIRELVANPVVDRPKMVSLMDVGLSESDLNCSSIVVDRPKMVSLMDVGLSESNLSCSSIALKPSKGNEKDFSEDTFDRSRTSGRWDRNLTRFETVRSTRPPTPYNHDKDSDIDEDILEFDLGNTDSNVVVVPGIFERDVEVDITSSINLSNGRFPYESSSEEHHEEGSYHNEDRYTIDVSKLPKGFPKEIIAALGNDSDAIMQAAIQWRRQFEGIFPTLAFSSSSESNENICRICHSGDSREGLIYPCKCDGTVRWTHQSCLITWIAQCGVMTCELCGTRYKIRLVGPRNCFRWKSIDMSINDKLHMLLFLFACAFLLVTFSFVVWFSVTHQDTAARESQSQIIFPIYSCLDAVALAIVCFEGKYTFLKLLRRWRAKNMGIIIMNRKESSEKVIEMSTVSEEREGVEAPDMPDEVDLEIRTPDV